MSPASAFLGGFAERLETSPDKPLLTFLADGTGEGTTWTYEGLHRRAGRVAAHLLERVDPGDRVILMAPPGLDYIAGFFGCLYAGVIAVPAYPPVGLHNLDNINRLFAIALDAGTATGLVTNEISAALQHMDFGGVAVTWVVIDSEEDRTGGARDEWDVQRLHSARPDDVAFLQYTSGSTGSPKGAVVTHGNLAAHMSMLGPAYGLPGRLEHAVSWLPPYHDMGLIGLVLAPAWFGLSCTLMPPAAFLRRPVRWLQVISRAGRTISAAPNFAYDMCVNKVAEEDLAELDLSRWFVAVNGAEPVRAATVNRFLNRFSACGFRASSLHPAFGMAEATLMVTTGSLGAGASVIRADPEALGADQVQPAADEAEAINLVTCGRPPEGTSIEIVDRESRERVQDGHVGEIVISGPHVVRGYWGRTNEAAGSFSGDSVATGDLGSIVNGELVVTGRIKDLLVIRGRNYYPQDIEQTAETAHPVLRPGNAAAFTIEEDAGESLVVVLEVAPAKVKNHAEVVERVRRSITSDHGIAAKSVVLIAPGRLPKTSSGKIRRSEARLRHLAGMLEPVASWSEA